MEYKFVEENGKEYQVVNCWKCNAELKFHLEDGERRIHGACLKCGHSFEVIIVSKKEKEKILKKQAKN